MYKERKEQQEEEERLVQEEEEERNRRDVEKKDRKGLNLTFRGEGGHMETSPVVVSVVSG